MQKATAICSLPILLLASCTTVPSLPKQYSVSVSDVVNNIRCELHRASLINPFLTYKNGWTAAVDLELKVSTTTGFEADASLTNPMSPQVLLVSIGGGHSAQAERTVNFSFNENLQDPNRIPCNNVPKTESGGQLLSGNLGVVDWVKILNETITTSNIDRPNILNKFDPVKAGYILEFTIGWKGNLGPSIDAVPVGHSTLKAGLSLTGERSAVHKLTIAFAPNPDEKPTAKTKRNEKIQRDLDIQILRSQNNTLQ